MSGRQAERVCLTCAHFRPARPGASEGECGAVLKGRYWVKGEGRLAVTITDARLEGCSGGWQPRGQGAR